MMLEQILTRTTNQHPYHLQVVSFWLSIGPVALIIVLLAVTQYWRIRRNRKSRRRVR